MVQQPLKLFSLLLMLTAGCIAEQNPGAPTYHYVAEITPDQQTVDDLSEFASEFARDEGFELHTESRKEMAFITQGMPAFASYLYLYGDPVVTLSNAGLGQILTIYVFERERLKNEELRALTDRLVERLEEQFALVLQIQ